MDPQPPPQIPSNPSTQEDAKKKQRFDQWLSGINAMRLPKPSTSN